MRNVRISLMLGVATLAFPGPSVAQEGMGGVMVKGKECAEYWSGSECTKATVPEGWQPIPARWDAETQRLIVEREKKRCEWRGLNAEECCGMFELQFRSDVKVRLESTGLEKDPRSACYQLPDDQAEQ